MIRIGIVGCGHIGTVHSFALRQLGDAGLVDARVVGTFDADYERAAGIARHHDARPCERLADVLARVPHQVGLVLRHAPVFRAAAELVAEGKYGRPLTTVLRDDQYFPIQGFYASAWRADVDKAGGGTLLEHSIHDVDVLRWVLGPAAGEPHEVAARTASMFGHPGIDDATTVTFRYEDGSTATIVSVWHEILTRGSRRRLEVFCEDALLWADDDYLGPLHVETRNGEELVAPPPPPWIDRFEVAEALAKPLAQYAEPSKAFLDALARDGAGAHGYPDAGIAIAAHRLVDRAYQSAAAGGRPVRCDPSPE